MISIPALTYGNEVCLVPAQRSALSVKSGMGPAVTMATLAP